MSTKTEERLRVLLDEHYENQMRTVDERIVSSYSSIFLFGFLVGYLLSHMNIITIFLSFLIGVMSSKKEPLMVNKFTDKIFGTMSNFNLSKILKNYINIW